MEVVVATPRPRPTLATNSMDNKARVQRVGAHGKSRCSITVEPSNDQRGSRVWLVILRSRTANQRLEGSLVGSGRDRDLATNRR
jgi:hypothetical protein